MCHFSQTPRRFWNKCPFLANGNPQSCLLRKGSNRRSRCIMVTAMRLLLRLLMRPPILPPPVLLLLRLLLLVLRTAFPRGVVECVSKGFVLRSLGLKGVSMRGVLGCGGCASN